MEPLAARLRPKNLKEFIGQNHLVGPGKPLRAAILKRHVFSFILWGPPGVGKTTLARIYARSVGLPMYELSAVSAGKEDIRRVLSGVFEQTVILFLDEIHRFNKAQQDFLLPYVEKGQLVLIGATTENPSFEVIPALLSRCRVFVLNNLSETELKKIMVRTGFKLDSESLNWLVAAAGGDARQALSILENTSHLYKEINLKNLLASLQDKKLRYDKGGEEHYNVISAFIKSLRAGSPDAALYYLARMVEGGEDPKFIARRMVIFASEDVGLSQPTALVVANEVFRAVETVGLPEAGLNLAQGAVYLATAGKDRRVYDGWQQALADVKKYGNLPIPKKILNAPTALLKKLGYGAGYKQYETEGLLPETLTDRHYWLNNETKPTKKK
ncbi:MAG: AAA family ATPase [Candidatus Vogelbacteria bacterium RIFOXYD1_FULL_46_19]|uniref:AAA family ATPase n=1 Tax=Candidatus Vogelbacteria bacterium RIFOXYD1_FULL_46_19 TaxID=1802439 RepID=A0A1G2QG70_9BACT|nr:MAG: AAA family ATPase [Candidatus Vogelbacteria bacterium RIFOXYD1_FULL_46_19]